MACRDGTPLTATSDSTSRQFYTPTVWAEQLDAYIADELDGPCILVVQGGLLPAVLELWRLGGAERIAGVSLLSPPPVGFFASQGEVESGTADDTAKSATTPATDSTAATPATDPTATTATTPVT